jgi:hypothetical protein
MVGQVVRHLIANQKIVSSNLTPSLFRNLPGLAGLKVGAQGCGWGVQDITSLSNNAVIAKMSRKS